MAQARGDAVVKGQALRASQRCRRGTRSTHKGRKRRWKTVVYKVREHGAKTAASTLSVSYSGDGSGGGSGSGGGGGGSGSSSSDASSHSNMSLCTSLCANHGFHNGVDILLK